MRTPQERAAAEQTVLEGAAQAKRRKGKGKSKRTEQESTARFKKARHRMTSRTAIVR